ncbi:hypothetical protein [Burkholderia mayonis]|uniref:hypothetical protein n=1 Tax=Burkholderia mayonis TaxID=1385591 RepID=UPI00131F1A48|nr:hypothetical protein [Burkholderia mayonis]
MPVMHDSRAERVHGRMAVAMPEPRGGKRGGATAPDARHASRANRCVLVEAEWTGDRTLAAEIRLDRMAQAARR